MGPVSAIYYLKQNKKRAGLMIFMLFFTCLMYLAGNYVDSINFYWKKGFEYSEKIAMISASSNDKDFVQYTELIEELKKDEKLTVLLRSGGGFIGYDWTCTLGWDMGSVSYIFNSAEDMGKAFDRLGIKCDMSEVKNKSIVISSAFAKNIVLKKGDKIQLVGFGTFEVTKRAAREGRNPQTGATMKIAASKAPKFKAGKALKDLVNKK